MGERYENHFAGVDLAFTLDDKTAQLMRHFFGNDATVEQLVERINRFRDRALQVVNFPCIQRYGFAAFKLIEQPAFRPERMDSVRVLDIGCCMGTDLRGVLALGGRPSNLVGVELQPDFVKLGFEFFGDADVPGMQDVFRTGNVLAPEAIAEGGALADLRRRFDYVYMGSILHLFSLADQTRLFDFLDAVVTGEGSGGVVFGRTTASPDQPYNSDGRDLHSIASLQELLRSRHYTDIDVHQVPTSEFSIAAAADEWRRRSGRILLAFSFRIRSSHL